MEKMEHSQMQTRPSYTQVVMQPQQQHHVQQPKIIYASSPANRPAQPNQVQYYERPMQLNMWTQTTFEDFSYLNDDLQREREQHRQNERDLLEKVRELEESLRSQSELLSQIHATSARKNSLIAEKQQLELQQMQQQHQQQLQQQKQYQIQQPQLQHEHYTITSTTSSPSVPREQQQLHATSVINAVTPPQAPPTESFKYTIIAEANGEATGEPIEIQLAEEDGALNLNSSTDSVGRLEICLADENVVDIKVENTTSHYQHSPPPPPLQQSPQLCMEPSTSIQAAMSRKNSIASSTSSSRSTAMDQTSPNSNYYFNAQGVLMTADNVYQQPPAQVTTTHRPVEATNRRSALVARRPTAATNRRKSFPNKSNANQTPPPNGPGPSVPPNKNPNIMVSIGPNNTRVPASLYDSINWESATISTRKLLCSIFDRETLATHSMTGKPSPAFRNCQKPLKKRLNPLAVEDIIFAVTRKCNVPDKTVRNSITTKCADENKMVKLKLLKAEEMEMGNANKENNENKENVLS